ncbi:MAG: hypothetical protein MJ145_00930 [Clostridia bacterium]|nr:hypothetical protein [Clostridia bacterium]
MTKLTFILRKLTDTNYKAIFKTASDIAKITGKSKLAILKDMADCTAKYGSGYVDYKDFRMYELSPEKRAEILTITKNNELVRTLNQAEYRDFFEDKEKFNRKFSKYLHREWMIINGENFEEFKAFVDGKPAVIVKPLGLSCGKGIEKVYPDQEKDLKATYDELYAHNCILVEELAKQCDEMSAFCTTSINTVRLVSVITNSGEPKLCAGVFRMGREGAYVDNFNHGGIGANVDVWKGETATDGYDKDRNIYEYTPVTNQKLKGFKIPQWEACEAMVKEAAMVVPQVRYVAWDVCIAPEGPLLIEGNSYPGQDLSQYPELGLGTYKAITDVLNS